MERVSILDQIYAPLKDQYSKDWFIDTERTVVRPMVKSDLKEVINIMCDEENQKMSGDYFTDEMIENGVCRQILDFKPIVEERQTYDNEFVFVSKETQKIIGTIQIIYTKDDYEVIKVDFEELIYRNKIINFHESLLEDNKKDSSSELTSELFEDSVSIGFSVNKKYWNQGYMTEVLSAVVKFCFQTLKVKLILMECLKTNLVSDKVIRKNNFKFLGEMNSVTRKEYVNRYYYKINETIK